MVKIGNPETVDVEAVQPKSYFGRFVRKQGQYGSVAVIGSVEGAIFEQIADPKRLFPTHGTAETQGVTQHAGLSPGDWVKFSVIRNTRPRAADYKVNHLQRIPRFSVLPEGSDAFYRTLLVHEGWRGDRRPGLWGLRLSDDRVIVIDLELGKDGALRIPRAAAHSVYFYRYTDDQVVRLGTDSFTEEAFITSGTERLGRFDWSDEADHIARVIRSLADADDPRINDLIAWLELHQEAGTGKVIAAGADQAAALDALRSGELAERLHADRNLMKAYLDAAINDAAVAAVVAKHAREGHSEARAKLLADLEEEISRQRSVQINELEAELAAKRATGITNLDKEIFNQRAGKVAEAERTIQLTLQDHADRMVQLDDDFQRRRAELDEQLKSSEMELTQIKNLISDSSSELAEVKGHLETDQRRARELAAEIDRLLSASDRLSMTPAAPPPALESAIPFAFQDGEWMSPQVLSQSIDRLAILSEKGRDLLRRLIVLMLAGELPILFGADAEDFVRVAGAVMSPGRIGLMRADPTLISIEDVWARPGSGAPTVMAAATKASSKGGSVLVGITDIESSGARFWFPALADLLRSPARPRGLMVFTITRDIDHEEIKAVPNDTCILEIEGAFATGACFGALALASASGAQKFVLNPGATTLNVNAASSAILALGFEPSIGLAMRVARIAAEAAVILGDGVDATTLTVKIVQDIHNQTS